jgi:hypothetical protein
MQSYRRPSISLIPLVHDNNDLPQPLGQDSVVGTSTKRYQVSRRGILFFPRRAIPIVKPYSTAVILSAMFFTVLTLLAIFIALFTSSVRAQESAAAAASSAAATEIPS